MGSGTKILGLLFSLYSFASFGQYNNYKYVDSTTLNLYYQNHWDSVILVGEKAIKNNVDYFYLRYRIGQAYLAKGKPISAIPHLEAARAFNEDDENNTGALYYSYLNSNKALEARMLISKLNPNLKSKYNVGNKLISELYFESGFSMSNNFKKNQDTVLLKPGVYYATHDLSGNSEYLHAGIKHDFTKGSQLYIGYTLLGMNKQRSVQSPKLAEIDNSPGMHPPIIWLNVVNELYQLKQNSINVSYSTLLNHKTKFTLATNIINVKYSNIYGTVTKFTDPITLFTEDVYTVANSDTSFFNEALSLNLNRRFKSSELALFGTISNFNGNNQIQIGTSATYYPFGNLNFYGYSAITGFHQDNENTNRIILTQMLGLKLTKKIWAEASYIYGNLSNFTDASTNTSFNASDYVGNKLQGNIIINLNPKIDIYLTYQNISRKSLSTEFNDNNDIITRKFNYVNQTITGGLKWKF